MPANEIRVRFVIEGQNINIVDDAGKKLGQVNRAVERSGKIAGGSAQAMRRLALRIGAAAAAYLGFRAAIQQGQALITAAAQAEALQLRLTNLLGSTEAATRAYGRMVKLAATTPFQLVGVVEAGVTLRAFGADIDDTLKAVSDLAAFMGTDIVMAAQAFGRAFAAGAGAADILRERGVLNLIKLKAGIEDLTKLTLPEFRRTLIATMQDPAAGIAGATDRLSKSWVGLVSNVQDAITELRRAVGEMLTRSTAAKQALSSLAEHINRIRNRVDEWVASNRKLIDARLQQFFDDAAKRLPEIASALLSIGKSMAAITENAARLAPKLQTIADILQGVADTISKLPPGVQGALFGGTAGLLVGGPKGALAGAALGLAAGAGVPQISPITPGEFFAGRTGPLSAHGATPSEALADLKRDLGVVEDKALGIKSATGKMATATTDAAEGASKLSRDLSKAATGAASITKEIQKTKQVTVDLGESLNRSIQRAVDAALTGGRGPSIRDVATALVSDFIGGLLEAELKKREFDQRITENFTIKLPGAMKTGAAAMSDAWSSAMSTMGTVTTHATAGLGSAFSSMFGDIASGAANAANAVGGSLRNVPGLGNLANVAALFGGGANIPPVAAPTAPMTGAEGMSVAVPIAGSGAPPAPSPGPLLAAGGVFLGLQALQASQGGFTGQEIGGLAGSGIGALAGSPFGPIGMLVGSFLGGQLGSFIGGGLTHRGRNEQKELFANVKSFLESLGVAETPGIRTKPPFVPATGTPSTELLAALGLSAAARGMAPSGGGFEEMVKFGIGGLEGLPQNAQNVLGSFLNLAGTTGLAPSGISRLTRRGIRQLTGGDLETALTQFASQRAETAQRAALEVWRRIQDDPRFFAKGLPGQKFLTHAGFEKLKETFTDLLQPTQEEIAAVAGLVDVFGNLPDEVDRTRLAMKAFTEDGRIDVEALTDAIDDTTQALASIEQFRGTATNLRSEAEAARFSLLGGRQQRARKLGRLGEIDAAIAELQASTGGIDIADELKQAQELLNERAGVGRFFVGLGGRKNVSIGASILEDTANTFESIADLTEQELDGLATNSAATDDNTAAVRANTAALLGRGSGDSGGSGSPQFNFNTTVNVENATDIDVMPRTLEPALLGLIRDNPRVRAAIRQVQVR